MKWFFTLALVSLTSCSDGTVYFGEPDPDEFDYKSTADSQRALSLTEIGNDIDTNTHEFYTMEEYGYYRRILAMPRSFDRSVTILETTEDRDFNIFDGSILLPSCYLTYTYAIDPPDTSLGLQDQLTIQLLSVKVSGPCPADFDVPEPGGSTEGTIIEDLVANTLRAQIYGQTWEFKKVQTINLGWQSLASENAPPKLAWPRAYPTPAGFLLWGQQLDEAKKPYAAHYADAEGRWTTLFDMEGAPTDLSWAAHAFRDGALTIASSEGIHTFDTRNMTWAATTDSALPELPPVQGADLAIGEDTMLLNLRGEDSEVSRFFLYRQRSGWREVSEGVPENVRAYQWQRMIWEGSAFFLPSYDGSFALFFPDTEIWRDGPAPGMSTFAYVGIRKIDDKIMFVGKSHAYELNRNDLTWKYVDKTFGVSPGSVRAESQDGLWALEFGSITQEFEMSSGGTFSNNHQHHIRLPEAVNIEATAVPAVAWANNRLFVWGGCAAFVDATCTSFSKKGYVTNTFIAP